MKSVRSAQLRNKQFQLKCSQEKNAAEKQLKRKIVMNQLEQVK